MQMRSYTITLTGKTALLMHADNIEWADRMEAWKNEPKSKKTSKPGDDRSPAFRWLGSLYHDGRIIAMPTDNLMTALREGGAMVPVPGGKSGKTFKSQTQSGMLVDGSYWPLHVDDAPIDVSPVLALEREPDFIEHQKRCVDLRFSLFVKRARVGATKHVRVRPMFERWSTSGVLNVWDEQITKDALAQIVTQAGLYKGLGDWRPGCRTPGPFGMFTAVVK